MDLNNPEPEVPIIPVPTTKDLRDQEVYLNSIPNELHYNKAPRPEDVAFLNWWQYGGDPENNIPAEPKDNIGLDTRMAHWNPDKGKFVIKIAIATQESSDDFTYTPKQFETVLKQQLQEFQEKYDLLEIEYLGMVDGSSVVQEKDGEFTYNNSKSLNMEGDILYFVPYVEPYSENYDTAGFSHRGLYNSPDGLRRFIGINLQDRNKDNQNYLERNNLHELLHNLFFEDHPFNNADHSLNTLVISPDLYKYYNAIMGYTGGTSLGIIDYYNLKWLDGPNDYTGNTIEQLSDVWTDTNIISEVSDFHGGGKDQLIIPYGRRAFISFDPRYVGYVQNSQERYTPLYFPSGENLVEFVQLSTKDSSVILGPTEGLSAPFRTIDLGGGSEYKEVIIPAEGDFGNHLLINRTSANNGQITFRVGNNIEDLHAELDPDNPNNIILRNSNGNTIILEDQMVSGRGFNQLALDDTTLILEDLRPPKMTPEQGVDYLNRFIENTLQAYEGKKKLEGTYFGSVDGITTIIRKNPGIDNKLLRLGDNLANPNYVLTHSDIDALKALFPDNQKVQNFPKLDRHYTDDVVTSSDVYNALPLKAALTFLGKERIEQYSQEISDKNITPEDMIWLMKSARLSVDEEGDQVCVGAAIARELADNYKSTLRNIMEGYGAQERERIFLQNLSQHPNVREFMEYAADGDPEKPYRNGLYAYNISLRFTDKDWEFIMNNLMSAPLTYEELKSGFDTIYSDAPSFAEIVCGGLQEFNSWPTPQPNQLENPLDDAEIGGISNPTIMNATVKNTKNLSV